MATLKNNYQPIDCNFYDILLERATLRRPAKIEYHSSSGPHTITAIIVDVYTQNKEEFMRLNNEQLIRLDQLIAVDDIPLPQDGNCQLK